MKRSQRPKPLKLPSPVAPKPSRKVGRPRKHYSDAHPPPLPPEAVAQIHEKLGGIDAHVAFLRSSPYHLSQFYNVHYPAIVGMEVTSHTTVTEGGISQAQIALEKLFGGLIDARDRDAAERAMIDVTPQTVDTHREPTASIKEASGRLRENPPENVQHRSTTDIAATETSVGVPKTPTQSDPLARPVEAASAPRSDRPEALYKRPSAPRSPAGTYANPVLGAVDREPSTTERFIEWSNSGASNAWRI
jgi:hypothetical protein